MGVVSNIVESVGDVVGGAVEAVGDLGSAIDDAVNDVVPGGWLTVGAAAGLGALGGLEGLGAGTLDAAATDAALEAASQEALAGWGAGGLTDAAALEAATGVADAVGAAEVASPWGLNASLPTSTAAEFGTFNPATIAAPGIDTSSLMGMEYLGGAGSLPVGTAGLTAEQIASAKALGAVGTNAASGLGYLGGAESLPAGTAGITGVTSGSLLDSLYKTLNDNPNLANQIGKAVSGLGGGTGGVSGTGTGTGSGAGLAALVRGNQSPFSFGTQTPVQSTTTNVQPTYLGQLANLLKG